MSPTEVINKIIRLPRIYHEVGNKSIIELLEESGYYECHKEITEDEIEKTLRDEPEFIDDWLIWSEDKRCDSGWFFLKVTSNVCAVGYYPKDDPTMKPNFNNPEAACAFFIKMELEDLRTSIKVSRDVIERLLNKKD